LWYCPDGCLPSRVGEEERSQKSLKGRFFLVVEFCNHLWSFKKFELKQKKDVGHTPLKLANALISLGRIRFAHMLFDKKVSRGPLVLTFAA
jgi:hypothetical protein